MPGSFPKLKLTYFDQPGRAEAIRLALFLGDVPFEDDRWSHEEFAKRRHSLPFERVPVLQVDDVVIAEFDAIVRYVGKLTGMYPTNDPWAAAQVDELLAAENEMLDKMGERWQQPDEVSMQRVVRELAEVVIPHYVACFDARLAKMQQKRFFQTETIFIHEYTIAETFVMLHSGYVEGISPDLAEQYPTFKKTALRVLDHPKVQRFWNEMHPFFGNQQQFKLTHFDAPALAEPIRVAFAIGGIEFEDERLSATEFEERKKALPFGELPVLEMNGEVVAQAVPILRYVGTMVGLYPSNDLLLAMRIDEMLSLTQDISAAATKIRKIEDEQQKAAANRVLFETTLPKILDTLDKRIAHWGGKYAVGEVLTIADLVVFGLVVVGETNQKQGLSTVELTAYENVRRIHQQVADHEKVKAWYAKH